MSKAVDVIIPVYNESVQIVRESIEACRATFATTPDIDATIIIVNDGSDPSFGVDELRNEEGIIYVRHERNTGYGTALKSGVRAGTSPWIAITDADGTYPIADMPKLVEQVGEFDMVVGVRTGEVSEIPMLRRFPKKMLNLFASYMSNTKIVDLNSGMRVFSRELCYYLWPFYPTGFSFTSTITMGAIMGGFRTLDCPINYFKREGSSSIKPIKDTIRFFRLVCRLGLIFYPMRLFMPVALVLFSAGFAKGIFKDYLLHGYIGNFSQLTMIAGIQVFMLGLLGNLIVLNRAFLGQTVLGSGASDSRDNRNVSKQSSASANDKGNVVHLN
jgi:glycosyltransferase involved in cell wall biosynthesis